MSEVDPDPNLPADGQGGQSLAGRPEPHVGDPTDGGKRGQVGATPGIATDEPADGTTFPVGGGRVSEESDAAPVADPGPDA